MVSNETYGVGVLASEMPRKSDLKERILSAGFHIKKKNIYILYIYKIYILIQLPSLEGVKDVRPNHRDNSLTKFSF